MRKHEEGDYRTKCGQGRVVRVGHKEWQAQEMQNFGMWSWVTTTPTKAQAVEALKSLSRGFIW